MYDSGVGVPQDSQKAVKYFTLSAAKGNADGQLNLGTPNQQSPGLFHFLRFARGPPNRHSFIHDERFFRAPGFVSLLQFFCSQLLLLAIYHRNNEDYQKAHEYFMLSSKQGNYIAHYFLGKTPKREFVHPHVWS